MAKKNEKESGYSMAVRITCIVLVALTLISTAGVLIYTLAL